MLAVALVLFIFFSFPQWSCWGTSSWPSLAVNFSMWPVAGGPVVTWGNLDFQKPCGNGINLKRMGYHIHS